MTITDPTPPKGLAVLAKIPVIAYIAFLVVFLSIIGGFIVLLSEGHNTDPLVNFLTQQLVPAIATVVGLVNYGKIRQVQDQTNGTTTALTTINAAQSAALAVSVPAQAVVVPAVVPPAAVPPTAAAIVPGMSPVAADLAGGAHQAPPA